MSSLNQNGVDNLRGIWPVLVTPFDSDLKVDFDAYRQMIEWHLLQGCHGIYALCLSSEMYQLDEEEQFSLIKEAIKTVNGRVPVAVTGNIKTSLSENVKFSQKAFDLGADVIMLTVPSHYSDESKIRDYFLSIAEQTNFPLGIYECPYPVHRPLTVNTIEQLAGTNRFYAYKETSCRIKKIQSILKVTQSSNLALLQANIPFLLDAQVAGAAGSMNVASNWLPDIVVEVYNLIQQNDIKKARELHRILCTMELAQRSVHPSGVKYLMSKRGLEIKPFTRLPKKLTEEEIKSLDLCYSWWFDSDHKLRAELLNPDTASYLTKT